MNQEQMLDDLAKRIQQMQIRAQEMARKRGHPLTLKRGFHAKGIGVRGKFKVHSDLPAHLHVGFFQPNAEYEALIRFSNARGEVLGDLAKDQRGAAFWVKTIPGAALSSNDHADIQDYLMSNTPISFARNPVQFIEVGEILLGGTARVFPRLIQKYGFKEARRILGVFLEPLISFLPLQMNQYWSRTSYKFGNHAIRYLIRPASGSKTLSSTQQLLDVLRSVVQGKPEKETYMQGKLLEALTDSELRFDFCIQLFVDEQKTPVEDAFIEWKEADSPPIPIATLTIPKQSLDPQLQAEMEHMAFNPWHTKDFTPLGLINLARKKVYDSSATHRGASLQNT